MGSLKLCSKPWIRRFWHIYSSTATAIFNVFRYRWSSSSLITTSNTTTIIFRFSSLFFAPFRFLLWPQREGKQPGRKWTTVASECLSWISTVFCWLCVDYWFCIFFLFVDIFLWVGDLVAFLLGWVSGSDFDVIYL